jgi:hypothetical protein
VKRRRRVVCLEPSRREVRFLRFVPTPVLDFRTSRDTNARSLKALAFARTTIHFCFWRQADWQEYSEFRKSALLALSASAIGKNGQLGIFRNSEYRKLD